MDVLQRWLIAAVRFYRAGVSPLKPPSCRFQPTCSAYALEALERHGAARGSWLALRRLLRCHPFCRGGFDPVPELVGASPGEENGGGTEIPSDAVGDGR